MRKRINEHKTRNTMFNFKIRRKIGMLYPRLKTNKTAREHSKKKV